MKIMSILVSCLANHLPNVRLRRSERLQAKNESIYTALSSGDYGHFNSLPLELKFLIFKYLTGWLLLVRSFFNLMILYASRSRSIVFGRVIFVFGCLCVCVCSYFQMWYYCLKNESFGELVHE